MSLMGIDIGTSGCKAVVFRRDGKMISRAYRSYGLRYCDSGCVVLPSLEVWRKVREVIAEAAGMSGNDPVCALAATSMGEAVVPFDAGGVMLDDCITGLDRRGSDLSHQLQTAISAEELYRITGLWPIPGLTLNNLMWIHRYRRKLWNNTACFLPWADVVAYRLCGRAVFNHSLAGRTLLFDLGAGSWSGNIAEASGVDLGKMPPLTGSGIPLGRIRSDVAGELNLSPETLIVSGTHDQCAASMGVGACRQNGVMLGLGTFACLVITHREGGDFSPFRSLKLNVELGAIDGLFASFAYHASGGALINWMRREFYRDLSEDDAYRFMYAEINDEAETPCVLPYFAGTGFPHEAGGGCGAFCDLGFNQSRAALLKGAMEGVVLFFREVLEKLRSFGVCPDEISITGGGSESEIWLRLVADLLETPVRQAEIPDCGALGAAILAGIGAGVFSGSAEAVAQMVRPGRLILPDPRAARRSAGLFRRYLDRRKRLFECGGGAGWR